MPSLGNAKYGCIEISLDLEKKQICDKSAFDFLLDSIYDKYDDEAFDKLTILYLDFAKAFHKVPYHILTEKHEKFEIGGKLGKVLHSNLEDRKQYVR